MLSSVRPGCRSFAGLCTRQLRESNSWNLLTLFLPQEPVIDLHRISGQDLLEVAKAKKSTAGGLDGWAWREIKSLQLAWFSGPAVLLNIVETTAVWPQGLLDAYIAMLPKVDGDSTPLGQHLLCVLPVIFRLWASLRLSHHKDWVQGWVPQSVFSLGNGVSPVEACVGD